MSKWNFNPKGRGCRTRRPDAGYTNIADSEEIKASLVHERNRGQHLDGRAETQNKHALASRAVAHILSLAGEYTCVVASPPGASLPDCCRCCRGVSIAAPTGCTMQSTVPTMRLPSSAINATASPLTRSAT